MKGIRVVFRRPGIVELEEYDVKPPRSGEVLVKTLYTLISPGTELAFLYALPNTPRKFPMVAGYSNVGVIEELGRGVSGLEVGQAVVSWSPHASYVTVSTEKVFSVPEDLSLEEASFFALGAICLQGVRKGGVEIGESALVIGLGLVGQLTAQLLRLSGAVPVIGLDLYEGRLKLARKLGADYVFNPSKVDVEKEILRLTEGKGASLTIEASGSPEAVNLAFRLTRKLGRVVLLGSSRGETTVNFYRDIHRRGLHVIGAHVSTVPEVESFRYYWTLKDEIKTFFKLLKMRSLNVKDLISVKLSFRDAGEAYELLRKEKDRVIGVLLDWTSA